MMDWLLLQLTDSGFPTGGFAHSGGLEAAWQHGAVRDVAALEDFVDAALWQTGHVVLPLANAAFDCERTLAELDAHCDAFLSNHVANRASRIQGRSLASTFESCFPTPGVRALGNRLRDEKLRRHYAPLLGALLRELGLERVAMQRLCLFVALRGLVSAGVRLGIVGPHQGQQLLLRRHATLDRVLERCAHLSTADLAQPAPLVELFQSTHDRLYSRLFQS
jgi:urease accessory protein